MKKRSVMMALGLVMTLTACGGGKCRNHSGTILRLRDTDRG